MAYITFAEMQQLLIDHINAGGKPLDYPDACRVAIERGLIHRDVPHYSSKHLMETPSDPEFERLLNRIPLGVIGESPVWPNDPDGDPDIFPFQHLYNPNSEDHVLNRFIIYLAFKGGFELKFQHKRYRMQAGDLVIIAPGCRSIAYMPLDSIVLGLSVDPAVFENCFSHASADSNAVSSFLHSVLYSGHSINYLLFHTGEGEGIKVCFKAIMLQKLSSDAYTEPLKKQILSMLLMQLVRYYNANVEYYRQSEQINLDAVLQYLHAHWKETSLKQLAERFGYNSNYLSGQIRKATGQTFTQLIRELRMHEASELLQQPGMKVSQVAVQTGFHSAEHFSRSFRAYFGMSPESYRSKAEKTSNNQR